MYLPLWKSIACWIVLKELRQSNVAKHESVSLDQALLHNSLSQIALIIERINEFEKKSGSYIVKFRKKL